MKNYVVCINGYGDGCDYTIDCNKTFQEIEAESIEDLLDKIHTEHEYVYMSGCGDDDYHTYKDVYVIEGELINVSDALRAKIRAEIEKDEAEKRKLEEEKEKELYKKLQKKYEKS